MKRFAVILIIAVLAIGCVFAATGDSQKTTNQNANSGDKFYVKTTIKPVYPVYQIVGTGWSTNDGSTEDTATSSHDSTIDSVWGVLDSDGKKISVSVVLNQYGKKNNDLQSSDNALIRYFGSVTVTVKASKLKNITNFGVTGHENYSDVPTLATAFAAASSLPTNVTVAGTTADTETDYTSGAVLVTYTDGKVVTGSDSAQTIAAGAFSWNIENLTAGDTYQADVVVTYTNE